MLPPEEFKPKTFNRSIRGYNPDEVENYIAFLLDKYSALYRENKELEFKLNAALQKSEQATSGEEEIKNTILVARKAADKIVADAQSAADLLYSAARSNTDRVLREFRDSIATEAIILRKLKLAVADMRSVIYKQYLTNIEQIENLAPKSKYEAQLAEPKTAEYIAAVIEGMKNDIGTSVEEIPQVEEASDHITITRDAAAPKRYRVTSVRETIRELNKQILSEDSQSQDGVTVDGNDVLSPDSDINQPKRRMPKKKKKKARNGDLFDSDDE